MAFDGFHSKDCYLVSHHPCDYYVVDREP